MSIFKIRKTTNKPENSTSWRDIALGYESTAISAQYDCVKLMVIIEQLIDPSDSTHSDDSDTIYCNYCGTIKHRKNYTEEWIDVPHKDDCPVALAKVIIADWEKRGWLKWREEELKRLHREKDEILSKAAQNG